MNNNSADVTSPTLPAHTVAPFKEVRYAVLGLGHRGTYHAQTLSALDKATVTAFCDRNPEKEQKNIEWFKENKDYIPFVPTGDGEEKWREIIARDDVDAVVICSSWELHTPMAVAAMKAGKQAFIEVPAALTIDECWQLVDTAEETGMNCMMLENCNYGREELALLEMCSKGLLGELLHGEAAYIHELREQMDPESISYIVWRTRHLVNKNGNLYPTHGVGPLAHCMNVNRGDNFDYLVSMSTPARGRALYGAQKLPADHEFNNVEKWNCGDLNTSIIKLVSGKTMMVQWDETSPRPYTRHNLLQGTKGTFGSYPNRIAVDYALDELPEAVRETTPSKDGRTNFHEWDTNIEPWFQSFDHPLWKKIGDAAEEHGGHGGMDYIMFWRLHQNLLNGKPMDQSVYDAAAWSAIGPLTEASIEQGSAPQKFPDFTRGKWKTTPPVEINLD
jgi:hypothetical protein